MTLMNSILRSLAYILLFLIDHVLFVVGTKFIAWLRTFVHPSCPVSFVTNYRPLVCRRRDADPL